MNCGKRKYYKLYYSTYVHIRERKKLKFANGGLLVVASHVVPFDTIRIVIVENSNTELRFTSISDVVTIIGLTHGVSVGVQKSEDMV